MEKIALLELIKNNLDSGSITKTDLMSLVDGGAPAAPAPALQAQSPVPTKDSHLNISKALYAFGGFIVLIGVAVFVSQFWADLGPIGKIVISLGSAVLAFTTGVLLSRNEQFTELAAAFHLIGGVMYPFGLYTVMTEGGMLVGTTEWIMIFAILTLLYAVTMLLVRHAVITFFVIAFATGALYMTADKVFSETTVREWYWYFTVIMGVAYLHLAYLFRGTSDEGINRVLYFFGSGWILGGAFALYEDVPGWEVIYPLVIVAVVAYSIMVRNMTALVFSAIALMAYVSYITGEYFADSIGWPLALVVIGLCFIATGYGTLFLRRTYLR